MTSTYQLIDEHDQLIDAHLELDGSDIVFHSRGGKSGAPKQRNSQYATGLRILLDRLAVAKITIDRVLVDSGAAQALSEMDREILGISDRNITPEQCFKHLSSRMKAIGQSSTAKGGNSTKRIRLKLDGKHSHTDLCAVLKLKLVDRPVRALKRLPAEQLNKVDADHIWDAIEMFINGTVKHSFGESTDYDLLVDGGVRLPPKAVFGVAAAQALKFEVLPEHLVTSSCFRILKKFGYEIVPKVSDLTTLPPIPPDREWEEGSKKAVAHFKKERAVGLSSAKKAQFRREHGHLECERCGTESLEKYPPEVADACIEVHHNRIHIKNMGEGHRTRLEDLQCLCANCHRIVHRELKILDGQ